MDKISDADFARAWKAGARTDAEIAAWVKANPAHDPNAIHREYASGNLARRMATENQQEKDALPNAGTQILGTVAAAGRDIPGAEALQAGATSLVSQPNRVLDALRMKVGMTPKLRPDKAPVQYDDALRQIRDAGDAAVLGTPARLAGGVLAASIIPGTPVLQGLGYGVAKGALQADPVGIQERAKDAAIGGAIGATAGGAGELVTTAAKMGGQPGAPVLDVLKRQSRKAIKSVDDPNYARVAQEASAAPPQSILAFNAPDIRPTAEAVRAMRQHAGKTDAEILPEVYKRLSADQGGLMDRVANAVRAKPTLSGEVGEIRLAKQELLNAADQAGVPTMRHAVGEHARMMGIDEARVLGSKGGKNLIRNTVPGENKILTESADALREAIPRMTPEEAAMGVKGLGGRLQQEIRASYNPLTAFGVIPNTARMNRAAPTMTRLTRQAGEYLPDALRAVGIAALTPTP